MTSEPASTAPGRRRLSLVRSPSGLVAIDAVRRRSFALPTGANALPLNGACDIESAPVAGHALPRDLRHLAAAWERLASSALHGPDVLADSLFVLLSTVPAAGSDVIPTPRVEAPTASRGPTAAHPRAFRGTKQAPPKPGRALRQDLRPLLCSTASTRTLLSALWPRRSAALHRLRQLGFDGTRLLRIERCAEPPSDPYLAVWHDGVPGNPHLPSSFVERVLASMKGLPWAELRRAAALCERLRVRGDDASLIAQLALRAARHALAWLEVLGGQPDDRRASMLLLVLETGAAQADPSLLPGKLLTDLAHAPAEMYACWTYRVLSAIQCGINPQYLAAGVHFALQYAPEAALARINNAPGFDDRTAAQLEELLPAEWAGWELIGLWETCGTVPGFSEYLGRTDWSMFSRPQRRWLLRFFMDLRWDQEGAIEARRWRAIAECIPMLERRVREIPPPYADQYLNDVGALLSSLRTVAEVREHWPRTIDLLVRVNRPPFDADGDIARSLGNLLKLPDVHRRCVLGAADATLLALDKACRRTNAATLIAWGLSSLVNGVPQLVADSFESATGSLIRTARQLGVLSWPARAQLVSRCARLRVFERGLETCSLTALVSTIDATGVAPAAAVVPRVLRDHLTGRRQLSASQIERHHDRIRGALPSARLAVVRAAVDSQLAGAIGSRAADRDALAALAVLQVAEKNRRGLRRFLRGYLNGEGDHLLGHPATRAWARRHPTIDLELWTRGLAPRCCLADGRELDLRLEQDPLEVLKMGTYVGSCFGLGGGLAYSAAAVLLDVNKQVLYARDDRGGVVARQLVALSDDGRLVAFRVYPESAAAALQLAFDQYDDELAAALQISRVKPLESYYIEHILSHEWWDDHAWDPGRVRGKALERRSPLHGRG